MAQDKQTETPKNALIKANLKRAFDEEAAKALPPELIDLIAKLKAQDGDGNK